MALPKVLISFLFLFFFILAMLKVESQNTTFAINTFTPHSLLLTYERDAFVPPDKSYVRLTAVNGSGNPRPNSVGRVLYTHPVVLWRRFGRQASFETTITLEMSPDGPYVNTRLGHGITFFMIPINSTRPSGGAGPNLGIYDAVAPGTPVFAVEFDIADSVWFNPLLPHVGININSPKSQNLTGSGIVRRRVTARIAYDVRTKLITVLATTNASDWETRVSFVFDLAAILPERVQVGLSASTGNPRVAYLDVYTWRFNSTMEDDIATGTSTDAKPYVM